MESVDSVYVKSRNYLWKTTMAERATKPFINEEGQGYKNAQHAQWSVLVKASLEEAHQLSEFFLSQFNMRSCLHYDDQFLSMCYGEAGSGAEPLRARLVAFTIGYFYGKTGRMLVEERNQNTTVIRERRMEKL
jgi:hypothetical protein